jgi:hypothetical protein
VQQASMANSISRAVGTAAAAGDLIRQFAHMLGVPSGPDDGYAEDEIEAAETRIGRLPEVLRIVYGSLGHRKDLVACQDPLIPPSLIRPDDDKGVLIFRAENQGSGDFGFSSAHRDDDPTAMFRPDVADQDHYKWTEWHPRLSLACIEILLSESLCSAPPHLRARSSTDLGNLATISDAYAAISELDSPLSPYTHWYAGADIFLKVTITDSVEREDPWYGPAPALAHVRARARTEDSVIELTRMLA